MNGINVSREKRVRQTKAIVHNRIEIRKPLRKKAELFWLLDWSILTI